MHGNILPRDILYPWCSEEKNLQDGTLPGIKIISSRSLAIKEEAIDLSEYVN